MRHGDGWNGRGFGRVKRRRGKGTVEESDDLPETHKKTPTLEMQLVIVGDKSWSDVGN